LEDWEELGDLPIRRLKTAAMVTSRISPACREKNGKPATRTNIVPNVDGNRSV